METTGAHRLRAAGLRVTRPRLSVLDVLAGQSHADADAIVTAARAVHPSLSPQAVYGVLRALVDRGLARRIQPAGAPALFELRVGDNHHHLVCRSCGAVADVDCAVGATPCLSPSDAAGFVIDEADAVADVDCAVGATPCLSPSDAAGFVIDEAEVVFWGLCSNCQNHQQDIRGGATA